MTSDGVWFTVKYRVIDEPFGDPQHESGPFFIRSAVDQEIASLAQLEDVIELEIWQYSPDIFNGTKLQPVIC